MTAANRIYRGPTGHRIGASHPKAKAPDIVVSYARALHEKGRTFAEIGRALGVNQRTVADWCKYITR
jgi:hypothetical protein